jgi:hypothetical protein
MKLSTHRALPVQIRAVGEFPEGASDRHHVIVSACGGHP